MRLGKHLGHKQHKNGKVRDGTPQHVSSSCENHGGCPYCLKNKMHSTHKREPVEEKDLMFHLMEIEILANLVVLAEFQYNVRKGPTTSGCLERTADKFDVELCVYASENGYTKEVGFDIERLGEKFLSEAYDRMGL